MWATRDGSPAGDRRSATARAVWAAGLLVMLLLATFPGPAESGKRNRSPAPCKKGKRCKPPPPPPSPAPRPPLRPASGKPPPNFVVIVTDDQDDVLESTSPAYMPALSRLVGSAGTRFANTLVSTSVCCPARVSLLTGKLAHCTNVTANWFPAGAWGKFARQSLDTDWLPGWLQEAGYRTVMVGKFLNSFNVPLGPKVRCPRGWDFFEALTSGTYNLFASTYSLNCGPSSPPMTGQYQTDTIRDKALAYIDGAVDAGKPLYLHLTPAAPHVDNGGPTGAWRPPPPAARHAGLYPGLKLPDNPGFRTPNPLIPDNRIDMSMAENVKLMTDLYVGRLRSLRAVDEMLESIVDKLAARGILNNTYVIFTSDNGLHMGQHGLDDGKGTNLEEDNRVPFYIAGPGVARGVVSPYQANLVDIPPTIMALAGLDIPANLDGLPLPMAGLTTDLYESAMRDAVAATTARAVPPATPPATLTPPPLWRRESTIIEAWDSDAKAGFYPGITFKALRLCSSLAPNFTEAMQRAGTSRRPALMVPQPTDTAALGPPIWCVKYSVWCKDNRRELYDLSTDPYELTNLVTDRAVPLPYLARLDALLSVLVHCAGPDCAHPYGVLHPKGDVLTFEQAMDPRHDVLYASLPRFAFKTCYPMYVAANERTFTLGLPGFPANASWEAAGIVWPLPGGARGLELKGDEGH